MGSIISSVLTVILSLPFLLAFSLILPACLSVRWLLLFIHCNRRGSNGPGPDLVRGNDGRWLGREWRSSVHHAVLVFEEKEGVNVDHFRRLLLKRVIPRYPRLTQRLISLPVFAGAGYCWLTDAKFSIDHHVFSGPSFLTSEKDLQDYVSKLVDDGLPEDKSPWQLQIFQSFGANHDTIAILRLHQSVADGTALMKLLCHSLGDSQSTEIPERPRSGSLAFCMNIFRACIVGPLTVLLWIFLLGEDYNILTHRSGWTGSVTVTWSASITLPKVNRIKQVTRSTVNCVLLSALAGALRRLLEGCGVKQPPDVKVVIPVDLRNQMTSGSFQSKLENKSSSLIMTLPVAIEGCIPRLWATRRTLDSLRTTSDPLILYVATAALMSIGSAALARHLVNFLTNKASLQFSSLPGPTSEILLEGQTLKGIYPILPAQANLGISITTITYADQVFVSVLAERALGPTAELILEYLEDQIEILWKLLLHRRVPGEQESSSLHRKEHISEMPSKQGEGELLNETTENEKDIKVSSLKAEFSELVNELKRRQSVSEVYASTKSKKLRRDNETHLTHSLDKSFELRTDEPAPVLETLKRTTYSFESDTDRGNTFESKDLARSSATDCRRSLPAQSKGNTDVSKKSTDVRDANVPCTNRGPNEFAHKNYLEFYKLSSKQLIQVPCHFYDIRAPDKLDESGDSEVAGGVLI